MKTAGRPQGTNTKSGRIPKVQPDMAATRPNKVAPTKREQATTDAQTQDYISRSRKDLKFLKSKRGDAPAHAKKAREAIDESREMLSQADKTAADRVAADAARYEGLSQAAKFAQAARDLGADQNEDAFKGVLRKLTKPKV